VVPVTSLDTYLDRACARLQVNPAETEDIREELRCHLEDLMRIHSAEGMDSRHAMAATLRDFGDASNLHDCLDSVHHGDPWWVLRVKGLGLGLLLGALLGLLIPVGGHLEYAVRAFPLPAGIDASRAQIAVNAMLAGGVIGLLSAAGRGLLTGWCVGSLLWLAEYVVHWIAAVAGGSVGAGSNVLNSVLLAPLLGGVFGAAVGAGSAAVLSYTSRIRPQIQ
jgi:hypothetical protein